METNLEIQPPPFNVSQALDTGFFTCGTSQSGKSNLAKWLVAALIRAGIIVYVIDPSRVWLHDTPIRQVIEIVEMRGQAGPWYGSTVFDISTLDSHDQIAFANTFCKYLNHQHINGETICKEFVVFEEAQTYLPNGCMRLSARKNNPLEGVLKLVTVGANYGLRFGLITQFPAMVDKAPVKISQQRYFGWTWEKNDVQYLKAFLGKEWSDRLGTLQKGEFLCQNRMSIQQIRTPIYGSEKACKNEFAYRWSFDAKRLQQWNPIEVVSAWPCQKGFLYTKSL